MTKPNNELTPEGLYTLLQSINPRDEAFEYGGVDAYGVKDWIDAWQSQLDAKDARIAELEEEVLEAQARLSEYGH